ncbi:hypothetical protein [Hyphococcus sp.]|uniref:hypothetical protein n=1 Tax=Hyphococcus sp. TaxID=2038636 RepID=UPI0020877D49|nr:MAG: hypothetical protein DHS20C04_27990 [Marinicaulis sp.]
MLLRLLSSIFALALLTPFAAAQEREGDYLYRVSTMRAAPGRLEELLNWFAAVKDSDFYKEAGESAPFLMRHSQGDQWDLLLITPMGSMQAFYKDNRIKKRDRAAGIIPTVAADPSDLIAFSEDMFANGPSLEVIKAAYESNTLFHIEMFHAAPGKYSELVQQRRMENAYLAATGQTQNMIFVNHTGSDVDVFTIGFHKSLQAFAEPSPATAEESESAAIAAGFKDRADISFYLRSLISSHHDTLAVKVE